MSLWFFFLVFLQRSRIGLHYFVFYISISLANVIRLSPKSFFFFSNRIMHMPWLLYISLYSYLSDLIVSLSDYLWYNCDNISDIYVVCHLPWNIYIYIYEYVYISILLYIFSVSLYIIWYSVIYSCIYVYYMYVLFYLIDEAYSLVWIFYCSLSIICLSLY